MEESTVAGFVHGKRSMAVSSCLFYNSELLEMRAEWWFFCWLIHFFPFQTVLCSMPGLCVLRVGWANVETCEKKQGTVLEQC